MSTPVELDMRPLVALKVTDHREFYRVGHQGVTAIIWSLFPGPHCNLPSVTVFKDGQPFSSHPFESVVGVYYAGREGELQS